MGDARRSFFQPRPRSAEIDTPNEMSATDITAYAPYDAIMKAPMSTPPTLLRRLGRPKKAKNIVGKMMVLITNPGTRMR